MSSIGTRKPATARPERALAEIEKSIIGKAQNFDSRDATFWKLTRDGLKSNGLIFSCIKTLAKAAKEPSLEAYDPITGQVILEHPMLDLLRYPNPWMTERRLAVYIMTYLAISGNAYLHKIRNASKEVIGLYPYSDGHIKPIPTADKWISHYRFDNGYDTPEIIDSEDIIHLMWDTIDPEAPWKGLGPMVAIVREIAVDNELTRTVYSFLRNDSIPRTMIMLLAGANEEDFKTKDNEKWEKMKQRWEERFGGDNKYGTALFRGQIDVKRLAVGLNELNTSILQQKPDVRIPAAFGLSPILVNTTTGLDRSTKANKKEARLEFIEDTMVPYYNETAGTISASLENDFRHYPPAALRYKLFEVKALQEKAIELEKHYAAMYKEGLYMRNESRAKAGLKEIEGQDVFAPERQYAIVSDQPQKKQEEPVDDEG